MVACHAENNIATVGADQAARGRAKHWIRVDRYYEGEFPDVKVKFMPVLCQQCDDAPCEPVCPTFATYHTEEGLNVQVYNRCIGTRYCANTCPYNVRFFNWYNPVWHKPLQLQLNPDVSVRGNGRDGEMHVLRAANQGAARSGRERKARSAGWRNQASLRAVVPGRSDGLRRPERSEEQSFAAGRSSRGMKLLGELGT